ncbi:MAG TPA: zinc-binding dehydrogenase [Kribbella sp.]|jgi:hypothetical protein
MDPAEGIGVIDWPALHQQVVKTFALGWDRPHPHAWGDFLAEDVELVQPMLRRGRGRDLWWDESRRLLAFLPDLRADVMSWAGKEDHRTESGDHHASDCWRRPGRKGTGFHGALGELAGLIEAGQVRIEVEQVLPLGEAAEAHRRLATGRTRGKLVLDITA